ncbi:Uncharacterised protein [Klebsiella pneumoniae subsp. ozaenae]|uniref:Single CXXC unit domain-containing protein n=1 Tax=Klebsiella pneumoniae subsp. ozaenae TaxID=574 RepID=A0A378A2M2_KLEPO|nr:Uncharacterised protein [Klebsiella pneumoniae subsp. ozaenae]
MAAHCALSGLRDLAPGLPPSQARQAQRRRAIYPTPCRVCAGWRLAPYPAYMIWRRVHPLRRPRQAQRRRAIYPTPCRVCGGWRLAPYPAYVIWRRVRPPFVGPASAAPPDNIPLHRARVCAGWRLAPYPGYVIWRRVHPLRRPGKRSAAGQSGREPVFVADGGSRFIRAT